MYEPQKYWDERMAQYGLDPRGAGNATLSVGENLAVFAGAVTTMIEHQIPVIFENANMLDIGVGNGYFIPFYKAWGAYRYTGIDITDKNFDKLQIMHRDCLFAKQDFTEEIHGDPIYDLIVMIDVEQHIVDDNKFKQIMENIKRVLRSGGCLLITTWDSPERIENTHYEVKRPFDDIAKHLDGYAFSDLFQYRDKYIFHAQKP